MAQWRKVIVSGSTAELNHVSSSGNLVPTITDGGSLGDISLNWSDLFLDSGAVINFNGGDVTATHASNLLTITGGNVRVDKLEIDGANDHIDVSTDMVLTAAADITLTPGGSNVKPGSDSAIDLGVSGTAFRKLFVDDIDFNAQGGIVGGLHVSASSFNASTHITASGDLYVATDGYVGGKFEVVGALTGSVISASGAISADALTLDTALPVAQGGIGATSLADKAVLISQDSGTDAVGSLALSTNGQIIVGGSSGPAAEAAADVAGTGLDASVGDGTLAINVAAAQTSITSIINSSLGKIGTAADQEYIDFSTSNEVNTKIGNSEIHSVTADGVDITGAVTISGNLDVNGSLTTIDSTNLRVADRFIYASSGSTSGDGGLIIGTGANGIGTAIGYDDSVKRWGLTKEDDTAHDATAIAPRQYVVSVSGSATAPSTNPHDFGTAAGDRIGMMHVNTDNGEIWIYS